MQGKNAWNKKEILGEIFKYINKDDCAVFLFGTLARGKVYPSSDIDIGIVCCRPLDIRVILRIKSGLEEIKTLRDIDVVDFSSITDRVFLEEALKEIEVWHQTKRSKKYLDNLKKRIKG